MKGSPRPSGFTIIEVMIVLGVSGVLFLAAALMISGRQNQTGFATSIQDFETEIQQVANDVANGYYPNFSNFSCSQTTPPSGQPILRYPGSKTQGTNGGLSTYTDTLQGCAFLGKAIQFAVNTANSPLIDVYPVVGNLAGSDGQPTQGLTGSYPVLLAQSGFGSLDANFTNEFIEQYTLHYGLTVAWMCYSMTAGSPCDHTTLNDPSLGHYQTAVVVFSTNQSNTSTGANQSFGTQQLSFAPIPGTTFGLSSTNAVDAVNNYLNNPNSGDPVGSGILSNPPGGIYVCLADATTNESGLLIIGGNNGGAQISMTIHDGSTDCS